MFSRLRASSDFRLLFMNNLSTSNVYRFHCYKSADGRDEKLKIVGRRAFRLNIFIMFTTFTIAARL